MQKAKRIFPPQSLVPIPNIQVLINILDAPSMELPRLISGLMSINQSIVIVSLSLEGENASVFQHGSGIAPQSLSG